MIGENRELGTDRSGHAEPGATGIAGLGNGIVKTVGATTTLKNAAIYFGDGF
jgi:hypothetical protein